MPSSTIVPPEISDGQTERYARHLVLPEIDEEGQAALLAARVVVVGAGGLGCPLIQALAASGVGTIRVIDPDVVELSNLQRQCLHTTARIGMPKVLSVAQAVAALNPDVCIDPRQDLLDASNAAQLLAGADVVIDGCDHGPTRLTVAETCDTLGIPLISGAIYQYEGQLTTFLPQQAPRLADVFPGLGTPLPGQSCADVGVFAPLCAMMGAWMAAETMKQLLGFGEGLHGKLALLDLLSARFRIIDLARGE